MGHQRDVPDYGLKDNQIDRVQKYHLLLWRRATTTEYRYTGGQILVQDVLLGILRSGTPYRLVHCNTERAIYYYLLLLL